MTHLRLFYGSSEEDARVKQILERWSVGKSSVALECESIHVNPSAVVRFGIHDLPALVVEEEVVAQGPFESWVLPLLERAFRPEGKNDANPISPGPHGGTEGAEPEGDTL